MLKKFFSLLLVSALVITMGICVTAAETSQTILITGIFGTKSELYVDLSKAVVDDNTLSASISRFGSGTVSATAVIGKSASNIVIKPSEKLDIGGAYTLTLNTSEGTVTQNFIYEILLSDNFENLEETTQNLQAYENTWTIENGYLKRTQHPYYPTFHKIEIGKNWSDYTVEFDYFDTLSSVGVKEGTEQKVSLKTFMYVNKFQWSLDSYTLYSMNSSICATTDTINNIYYVPSTATSNSDISKATGYEIIDGSAKINNKDVTYSTSVFGNDVYSRVINKANNSLIFSNAYTIPTTLMSTSGGFAITAKTEYNGSDSHPTYMDNLLCYKLKAIDINYTSNEDVSAYGSKGNLVFKFANDVINADVVLKDFNNNILDAKSSYSNNTLVAKPSNELDIDGIYNVTINYGIAKEFSKTLNFGYEVLFKDDFSSSNKTNSNFHNQNWDNIPVWSVENGRFIKNGILATYAFKTQKTPEMELWKDYTVEFDFLATEKKDYTTLPPNLTLNVFFYTNNSTPVTTDENSLENYGFLVGRKEKAPIARDVRYCASLFGTEAYSTVTDIKENKVLSTFNQNNKEGTLGATSGGFGISGYFNWNDSSNNVFDNVLCYKLKTYDINYTDNENIVSYGSKGNLVFKFGNDVIKAEAILTDSKNNAVSSTSAYKNKTLIVTPTNELNINGIYNITINYGAIKEKTAQKQIGYEVLYKDDFTSDLISNSNIFNGISWSDNNPIWQLSEGKLTKNKNLTTYAMLTKQTKDNAMWKDYTVEFDFLATQKKDYTTPLKSLYLDVFFYTNKNLGGNENLLLEKNGINKYGYLVTRMEGNSPLRDVRYCASLFGTESYSKVTDIANNTVLSSFTASDLKGTLGSTSGNFAISGCYDWNDPSANVFDNLLCYKLYEISGTDVRFEDLTINADSITLNNISFINPTNAMTPIMAAYGVNGNLLGTAVGNAQSTVLTVTGINPAVIAKVRLMFWDDENKMHPFINSKFVK